MRITLGTSIMETLHIPNPSKLIKNMYVMYVTLIAAISYLSKCRLCQTVFFV